MAKGLPNSHRYIKDLQEPFSFSSDGKFRILHLTDIHEVDPEMDDDENRLIPENRTKETMNVIERCLEEAKPDLVVFGGDNISGYWQEFTYDYMYKTIKRIVEPIKKRNIPLAIVFGNHDAEAEYALPFLNKENQISVYCEYENFRSSFNDEDVFGCANCSLPILSSDKSRVAFNIWCIDSNDYLRDEKHRVIKDGGYAEVTPSQIEWYEKRAKELKDKNGGKTVPAILFQHIPVLQEYDLLKEAEKREGAFEHDGKYYEVKDGAFSNGVMREAPCPPKNGRAQFESWKKTGDIIAAFFGHDHTNTFTANLDGIDLVQTIGAGYHTYGKERGGRIIVLDENRPDSYESRLIFADRITDGEI